MSKVTRRQVIRAGVAAGAALSAGTANAAPEKEKPSSFADRFLPTQRTKEEIQAPKGATFTKLEFAGATFWVGIVGFGDGVPHTWIGIYAPDKAGVFHRSLFAESWAAGKIEAGVDAKTGILELRERANSELKGQVVLSCNLKTIGTQHSIEAK
jgi:hypothetical protein